MKIVKPNLKKMLEEIEWVVLEKHRHTVKLKDDEVSVTFSSTAKNPDNVDRVNIRMGKEIIDKLKWNPGDKIVVMNDKHNVMNFLLVKTEAGTGYTLGKVTSGEGYRINFKWKYQKDLKKFNGVVQHYIKNNQLIIFTVKPEKGIL